MALTVNFDSPQAVTGAQITITGTTPAGATLLAAVGVIVQRGGTGATTPFYISRQYFSTADSAISENVLVAIYPPISTVDSVTPTLLSSISGAIEILTDSQ